MNAWTIFLLGSLFGAALFAGADNWLVKQWLYWRKEAKFLRAYTRTPEE